MAASPFRLREGAERGDVAMVEKELMDGVDINAATANTACTALHKAALRGRTEVVHALLRAGANAELRTSTGLTAAEIAEDSGFWEIVDAIKALHAGTLRVMGPPRRPGLSADSASPAEHSLSGTQALLERSSPSAVRSTSVASGLRAPRSYTEGTDQWYHDQEHRRRREKRRQEFSELLTVTQVRTADPRLARRCRGWAERLSWRRAGLVPIHRRAPRRNRRAPARAACRRLTPAGAPCGRGEPRPAVVTEERTAAAL